MGDVSLSDIIDPAAEARLRALAAGAAPEDDPADEAKGAELVDVSSDDLEVKDESSDQIEHKAAPVGGGTQVLEADDKTGRVVALVSVTGIEDRVKDVIEPGAYTKTLATREPIGVWSHDDKTWVARTESAVELPPGDPFFKGLTTMDGKPWPKEAGAVKVEAQFNLETPHGKAAYSDVKFFQGKTGWSIGYRATKAHRNMRTGVRHIKELDWFEYSPVMVGAASQPMTLAVKSLAQPVDPTEPTGYADGGVLATLSESELAAYVELKSAMGLEVKDIVRTPEGARRYGQPIGTKIVRDRIPAGAVKVGDHVDYRGVGPGGPSDPVDVQGKVTAVETKPSGHVVLTVDGKKQAGLGPKDPVEVVRAEGDAAAGAGDPSAAPKSEGDVRARLEGMKAGELVTVTTNQGNSRYFRKDPTGFVEANADGSDKGNAPRRPSTVELSRVLFTAQQRESDGVKVSYGKGGSAAKPDGGKEPSSASLASVSKLSDESLHDLLAKAEADSPTAEAVRAELEKRKAKNSGGDADPDAAGKREMGAISDDFRDAGGKPADLGGRRKESQIADAEANPVRSRDHQFSAAEQSDYGSLDRHGRTLYDNLRTKHDWSHADAFAAAKDKHGTKADKAAARDRAADTEANQRTKDREALAAYNRKRKAQGKPPVLRLPATSRAADAQERAEAPSSGKSSWPQAARDAKRQGDGSVNPSENPMGTQGTGTGLNQFSDMAAGLGNRDLEMSIELHKRMFEDGSLSENSAPYHMMLAMQDELGIRKELGVWDGDLAKFQAYGGGGGAGGGDRDPRRTGESIAQLVERDPAAARTWASSLPKDDLDRQSIERRLKGRKGFEDLEVKRSSASLDRSPKANWVERAGELPAYIREVARAIHEDHGTPLDRAIPMAIGRIKKWAAGVGNVTAETRAKAQAAVAAWEALKAKSGKKFDSELLAWLEHKTLTMITEVDAAWDTLAAYGEVKALFDELGFSTAGEEPVGEVVEVKAAPVEDELVDITDLFARGSEVKSAVQS